MVATKHTYCPAFSVDFCFVIKNFMLFVAGFLGTYGVMQGISNTGSTTNDGQSMPAPQPFLASNYESMTSTAPPAAYGINQPSYPHQYHQQFGAQQSTVTPAFLQQ